MSTSVEWRGLPLNRLPEHVDCTVAFQNEIEGARLCDYDLIDNCVYMVCTHQFSVKWQHVAWVINHHTIREEKNG